MPDFHDRLVQSITEHLKSDTCRYVDNDMNYYMTENPSYLEKDRKHFEDNDYDPHHINIDYALGNLADKIRMQADEKSYFYDILDDEYSKNMLVLVATYNILGHLFVKFPYYGCDNLKRRRELYDLAHCPSGNPDIDEKFRNGFFGQMFPCFFYDGKKAGLNAQLYTYAENFYSMIEKHNYEYILENGERIGVREGDYVFDCGMEIGDTAILFALAAGNSGKIYSFEPHPFFYVAAKHNINLNHHLADRIHSIKKAVYSTAGKKLRFELVSPGSRIIDTPREYVNSIIVETTTIDRQAARLGLDRLDFIKMDIEGAELEALRGAEETLRKFKPKLAVCLYHKPGDYLKIPKFINELGIGYRFYFDHTSPTGWDSICFATVA